jgi:hypothetical protein
MNLFHHLTRAIVFSKATFGPGARTNGVLDHITKEIEEVRKGDGDPEEWVDLVILSLDGLTRELLNTGTTNTGYNRTVNDVASLACDMIMAKQHKNEMRTWPDWRSMDPNKAIEHDRTGE